MFDRIVGSNNPPVSLGQTSNSSIETENSGQDMGKRRIAVHKTLTD